MSEMTDDQFLSYCRSMTRTERCGFVPQTLARLFRLAGDEENAAYWDAQPNQIIDHCHDEIGELVDRARALRAAEQHFKENPPKLNGDGPDVLGI